MKKITLLFSAIFALFTISSFAQDTCSTALTVTSGTPNTTTINFGSGGAMMSTFNDNIYDDDGEDSAWYVYTATADGTIEVNSCMGGSDTNLFVGVTADCTTFTSIAENDDFCDRGDGFGYASSISGYAVTNGDTYYIEWNNLWDNGPFDWTLTFTPAPECSQPTNIQRTFLTDLQVDFSWEAAEFGSVVDYDWEVVPDGNGQGVGVVASGSTSSLSASATGLTPGTDYDIYVRTDCGNPPASSYVGPFSFTTLLVPPPSNDICSGATTVTEETDIATAAGATPIAGTVLNATNTTVPAEECANYIGDANDDIWYSFVAQSNVVTITVDSDFDSVLTLYSGADCGSLVFKQCSDSGAGSPSSEQIVASVIAGETYYFRVYYFLDTAAPNPDFTVKVWTSSPNTLGIDDVVANNNFTYYPNPVKQTLNLKAQSNIQNVAIYNMLGQEVLKTAPNTLDSEVNMSALSNGAYFVKVTINDTTKTVRIIKQ